MAYITKDGKWLAYRDATEEILEYDDFSDVQQVYQPEWFWVDDKDDAKEFHAESIASSFLVRRRGGVLKRLKYDFRATASTALNKVNYNSNWIELQLAHVCGNRTKSIIQSCKTLKWVKKNDARLG